MPENPTARKIAEREQQHPSLKIDLRNDRNGVPDTPLSAEKNYRQRKAEVSQQDHNEFLQYQQAKARETAAAQAHPQPTDEVRAKPAKVDRRNFLTVVAGTAAVGEAAVLGYSIVKDQIIPAHGARHAGDTYTKAQRHNIERELINPKADLGGRGFGDWVLLVPTKMGGGTYAVNLNTGRCLAWISFWPYGDFNPISHHLCAFPSADPAQGLEWINSTQGGRIH